METKTRLLYMKQFLEMWQKLILTVILTNLNKDFNVFWHHRTKVCKIEDHLVKLVPTKTSDSLNNKPLENDFITDIPKKQGCRGW